AVGNGDSVSASVDIHSCDGPNESRNASLEMLHVRVVEVGASASILALVKTSLPQRLAHSLSFDNHRAELLRNRHELKAKTDFDRAGVDLHSARNGCVSNPACS